MNQQMIHQYGTKRKQDQSQLEQGMEGLSMNSYQSLEIRRSFIPIIHRNCILAMHNLVQAVIHTFNLPIDLTNNSLMKAAVNCILEEKDRAVSFEDWSLNEDISKMILYLWNNSDSIREAYRRRNELEIEYMDSARYWFNEMYRLVDPNYVPKIEDIMRMRVKTTGIVETELFLPIKVRKKFPSTNMLDHMEETQVQQVQTEKIIYQKSAVVLVGSQRNERKKWIHAFDDVSAIIFVVALSEYNQLLYEDGRTNRMHESLLLFSEIANSRRFENVPIFLFFNKHDIFMEKIQVADLSSAFPDIPDNLKIENQPWCDFVPHIIQKQLDIANKSLTQNMNKQIKLADELKSFEEQRDAVLSDEEIDEGISEGKKSRPEHKYSLFSVFNRKTRRRRKSQPSRMLIQRIEEISQASESPVCSTPLEEKNIIYSEDVSNPEKNDANDIFDDVPYDIILYIFMFLDPRDLCNGINLTCMDWYQIAESDILWRAYCLRYQKNLKDATVLKVYEEYKAGLSTNLETEWKAISESNKNIIDIYSKMETTGLVLNIENGSPNSSCSNLSLESQPQKSPRLMEKGPYKHYYQFGEMFVRRNINYITNQFLAQTNRKDIRVEVTCVIDTQSFKPIMERTIASILKVPRRNKS